MATTNSMMPQASSPAIAAGRAEFQAMGEPPVEASPTRPRPLIRPARGLGFCSVLWAWAASLILGQAIQAAEETAHNASTFALVAYESFKAAESNYVGVPTDLELAWKFGRACFDLAEYATNKAQRAQAAKKGIAACRAVVQSQPKHAAGNYYLGMNLGQLARTEGLAALGALRDMEKCWLTAREADAGLDYGGADRCLGLLYRDSPFKPLGIKDKTKARKHLEHAVELSPDYPENHLNLVESYLKWNDKSAVKREFQALEEMWPRAQAALTGEAWTASWIDWNHRRETLVASRFVSRSADSARTNQPVSKRPGERVVTHRPETYPQVAPLHEAVGKVATVNPKLRFVVLDYLLSAPPAVNQRLNVYRQGQKVGELKVTGPARNTTTVADIVAGEVQAGDEAREN